MERDLGNGVDFLGGKWKPVHSALEFDASAEFVLLKVPMDFDLELLASATLNPEPVSSLAVVAPGKHGMQSFGPPAMAFRVVSGLKPTAQPAVVRLAKLPLLPPKRRRPSAAPEGAQPADGEQGAPPSSESKKKKKKKKKTNEESA